MSNNNNNTEDAFQLATRQKLRFKSTKVELTIEQLWDLPLSARDGFDLDNVAKLTNTELKNISEGSFVRSRKNPAQDKLELALEIVKHIIAVKIDEEEKAKKRAENRQEEAKLLEILDSQEEEALKKLSPEALRERLKKLKAED